MLQALLPHHDGSRLYVLNQRPKLNDNVLLKVRIHQSLGQVTKVSARYSDNGEAFFSKRAKPTPGADGWVWWELSIPVLNPKVNYRFLIEFSEGNAKWLNTQGLSEVEPLDVLDFRITTFADSPSWSKSAVMYQIFPDRFARSSEADQREVPEWAVKKNWSDPVSPSGPDVSTQFFGGDLQGVIDHLDHLHSLGVNLIYLTPIFPARSNHRYDATSFDEVDPLLGGNQALQKLVEAAHDKGMKVIGDLTSNHCGSDHEWFQAALGNPEAPESEFFFFSKENTEYQSWWGVPSLPKLNWNSKELRRRFIEGPNSVVAKWLKPPYSLDGWRIDVANMTGRFEDQDLYDDVAKTIKKTMQAENPEALLLGEYTKDAASNMQGDGYHGAMTYFNFTKPLWLWFANENINIYHDFPGPGPTRYSGKQFLQAHLQFAANFPWAVRQNNMNALDTHDIPRFKTVSVLGSQLVGAGLQFTLPGIPVIFAGDEFGLDGNNGEHSRTPMPWEGQRQIDKSLPEAYAKLAQIRKDNPVLVEGALRWLYASDEAVVFAREDVTGTILVSATRFEDPNIKIPMDAITDTDQAENLFGGGEIRVIGSSLLLPGRALSVNIWRLPAPKQ
jgi:alpha-glucosidase